MKSLSVDDVHVSTPFKEILKLPNPVAKKNSRTIVALPSHISGNEMISILEEKMKKKEEEEAKKLQRKLAT